MYSSKNGLFKKFAIFSFIAFAATGIILVMIITKHIRTDFASFMPVDVFEDHIKDIERIIFAVVFLGLLALYLLLIRIIHRASSTLVLQNRDLMRQKNEIIDSYNALQNTYKDTVNTLSRAVDARDPYTAGHSERVASISGGIAKKLGLGKTDIELVELSAQFHDIGKIGIPDNILLKPERLTAEEFDVIKSHPAIGTRILSNIEFLKDCLPIILHHHENYDGSGYPSGLHGKDIPIGSRIIRIADAFDAMTSDRPYRKKLSDQEAIQEISKYKGIQFDSELTDTALSVIENPIDKRFI